VLATGTFEAGQVVAIRVGVIRGFP
jgi:hypothetical protein